MKTNQVIALLPDPRRRLTHSHFTCVTCVMRKQAMARGRDGTAPFPNWLVEFMENERLELWGAADLSEFTTPSDSEGVGFPAAISWIVPMDPAIMAGIRNGPNEAYAAAYTEANERINDVASRLAAELRRRDARAMPLAASVRTDEVALRGDFPHKTAATRAGLGWIGRHCQLVTLDYGPWVRLGTVFTDMELPCGPPVEKDFCGKCSECVEACPADALSGEKWYPGLPREAILDARACDIWKTKHYPAHNGKHNCGICSSACPFGHKSMRRRQKLKPAL